MDVRRFGRAVPLAVVHARADRRELRDLLRHRLPGPASARPAGRCARRRPTRGTSRTAPSFGEKSGWERVNYYETQRRRSATSRCGRAAGPGGYWSPAIAAEHAATREAAGAVRRVVVRQDRGDRPGRRRAARVGVRQPTWRAAVGDDHLHAGAQPARRHRVGLHRHPRRATTRSWSSPARRSARTTWPGCARQARRRGARRAHRRRHRPARHATPCGDRAAATILAPLTPARPVATRRSRS